VRDRAAVVKPTTWERRGGSVGDGLAAAAKLRYSAFATDLTRVPERAAMTDRYTKGFPVSWDQLHRDAKALAGRGPWRRIVTVTRGGMVPACIVARELDVRLVDTVCVISYEHQNQGAVTVLKPVGDDGPDVLIIDDLVDTGRTATAVRAMLPQAHYATVYAKPEGRPLVDTFVTEVSQDTWIYLPWDTELQFVQPIASAPPEG